MGANLASFIPHIHAVIAAALALMLLPVAGCSSVQMPAYALIVNPSQSNVAQIDSHDFEMLVRNIVYRTRSSDLFVIVAAADPLEHAYRYPESRDINAERIMEDLRGDRTRQEQTTKSYSGNTGDNAQSADAKGGLGVDWGHGTDHGAAIMRAAEHHPVTTPLIVVMVTDGFNEKHNFAEIDKSLAGLYAKGPTRIIVAGLSQGLLPSSEAGGSETKAKTTVFDRWQAAFNSCGAVEAKPGAMSSPGNSCFLTTSLQFPYELLEMPFSKVE